MCTQIWKPLAWRYLLIWPQHCTNSRDGIYDQSHCTKRETNSEMKPSAQGPGGSVAERGRNRVPCPRALHELVDSEKPLLTGTGSSFPF